MSLLLYNIFIAAYNFAAMCVALFSAKAKQFVEGRAQAVNFLKHSTTPLNKHRIWVHCSSLGEFEQAKPLLQKLKNELPDCFVLLTFFSPSGFNVHAKTKLADWVLYLPADTAQNAALLVQTFQPTLVLWTKYDFYHHFLHQLKSATVPAVLFSARFLPQQIFFKPYAGFFRNMLSCFSAVFVQDETSVELLKSIGIDSIQAHDTRFDRVAEVAKNPVELSKIKRFVNGRKTMVCGSTWAGDEEMLSAIINRKIFSNTCWIIAPHNIAKEDIERVQNTFATSKIKLSNLKESDADVLIVDNMGMLSSLYSLADVAYVGGGFGTSVHNVLEAAVYGIPVLFGPNHKKSIECMELIQQNAAFTFGSSSALEQHLHSLLGNANAVKTGEIAKQYVMQRTGGADKIFNFVRNQFMA